jgi:hypothetical protein
LLKRSPLSVTPGVAQGGHRFMQLSAELYSQIVKDLTSDGLGEFGRQQRREPRVGVRARAYILPSLSATTPIPVRVRDMSVSGIGLLLPRELGPDRLFLLLLPKVGGQPPLRLACTVAHCQAIGDDLYAVGARFARWDEIASLGPEVTCRSREWPAKAGAAPRKKAAAEKATAATVGSKSKGSARAARGSAVASKGAEPTEAPAVTP